MKIIELLKVLEKYEVVGHLGNYEIKETDVTQLHHDSRKVVVGSMFFCLDGTCVSGVKFAWEAVKNGAVCVITEEWQESIHVVQIVVPDVREAMSLMAKCFYGSMVNEMRVIGVVGTNGKTTCAHIMKHILETAGERVGILGTLHGVMTTPDPIDLHRTIKEMHTEGIRVVVMEVSAHAIHFKKVAGITFEVVIFTNITQDHLDFFGTFDKYADTKVGFMLGEDIKTAVINTGNEFGRKIMSERKGSSIEYALCDVQLFPDRSVIGEFDVNLPARFNAENALGCIAAAKVLVIEGPIIKQALKSIPRIPGRFNVFKLGDVTVIIDFAHSPDGLEKIIMSVKEFATKKVITVFGCGGNRDKGKRPAMGEISARLSDFTVITSDNPRFERPISIMKQIRKGFKAQKNKNFTMVVDRVKAIEYALGFAQEGDIVIIAGKGGETYTEIKGRMIEYADESVIATHIRNGV